MPVVLKTTAASRDDYERVVAIIGEDLEPGCIVHTASEVDGAVEIVDVWESRQAIEEFFQNKLGPAFAQAGLEDQPAPQLTETFRIERG